MEIFILVTGYGRIREKNYTHLECSNVKCGKKASTLQRQFIGNYFDFSYFASS